MNVTAPRSQDKQKEIVFFDRHAASDEYAVFLPQTYNRLIDTFIKISGIAPGSRIADLGCGSGVFCGLLQKAGFNCVGLDISPRLIEIGRRKYQEVEFVEGDIEHTPFPSESFDAVLMNGVVHHLPDPSQSAAEVFRILRKGGRFIALDPNRRNPFMWLYRDPASPFYSSVGVTENERPVLASDVATTFRNAGFDIHTEYLSDIRYSYIASSAMRRLLPIYNAIDGTLFTPRFMSRFRSFVLTLGEKQ
jgi:ubiquinone/menaquinone biosynthesis C-methylase UbiE